MQPAAASRVDVQLLQLVDAGQAEQAVAGDEPVIEEAERAFAVHGDQPQATAWPSRPRAG